jgi:hypothetical protein
MNKLTPEQRVKVEGFFNKHLGEGETLEEWIRGEIWRGDNQKKALCLLKNGRKRHIIKIGMEEKH